VLTTPDSPAAVAFRTLAEAIATDLLPPIEMSGCTARLFDLVARADA
jgi:hypothetical protein